MTEVVGLYARISEDVLGLERGVSRQLAEERELAERRGWATRPDLEFCDNDVSALNGAYRPGYEALLAAAESGSITRIVAWQLSRLWRNRRERAEAIDRLSKVRVPITLVRGGDIDLSSPYGRSSVAQQGEADTLESELKSERVMAAAAERAAAGQANGAVLYGWRRVNQIGKHGKRISFVDEIDPAEASVVQEIVDRLLALESLKRITADLNARKIPTPNGTPEQLGTWLPSTVRKLALRRANIARRVHHRGRPDETETDAAWPPIVDRDKHERVLVLLSDPARVTSRMGARRHLLSFGIGHCGKAGCGSHLRVVTKWRDRAKTVPYTCYQCDGPSSCVTRAQTPVDDLVERVIVRRLAQPDARDLLTRDDTAARAARERAEHLRAKLNQAQDDYDRDLIDREMFLRSTARNRALLVEAEREAAKQVRGIAPELLEQLAGPHAQAKWKALAIEQKRALLEALEVRVTILPARGGPGFKPTSVRITFGGQEQGER